MHAFITPFIVIPRRQSGTNQPQSLCAFSPSAASSTRLSDSTPPLPPIVFVLGGPGSGKGTQCARLKRDYGFEQVCVGDLLRREAKHGTPLGKNVADIMQRGEIVPGEVTMELLRGELSALAGVRQGVLIDGFPRAMDQAGAFEKVVAACCFVLFFQCDEEEMVARLLKRGETSGRADDTEEIVRKRLKTFIDKTMPVIQHYRERGLLREVDSGSGDPEQVYARTKKVFDSVFGK